VSDGQLRALAGTAGQALTYTCVPPGSGRRVDIDRDEDGFLDGDERAAGTDPADPTSFPGASPVLVPTKALTLKDTSATKRSVSFKSSTKGAATHIVPPAAGGIADPTLNGAALIVYNSAGLTTDAVTVDLPASGWARIGGATVKGWRYKSQDAVGGIKSVVVKADTITVKGGKAEWAYTLNEDAQGSVAMRLRLGNGEGWCADAPARLTGNPASPVKSDHQGLFKSQAKAPAPATCPPVVGPGPPSGAFVQ
jgi:hypothetical protein